MSQLVIRPAASLEAPELSRLALASKSFWGYGDDQLALWCDELTVSEGLISTARVECAVLGGQVVGFFALVDHGPVAELEHLWVRLGHMRRGIGAALLERAVSAARGDGRRTLVVVSDPHAAGFYVRMGATQVGEHESTPPGRCLPVLSLDLDVDRPR